MLGKMERIQPEWCYNYRTKKKSTLLREVIYNIRLSPSLVSSSKRTD